MHIYLYRNEVPDILSQYPFCDFVAALKLKMFLSTRTMGLMEIPLFWPLFDKNLAVASWCATMCDVAIMPESLVCEQYEENDNMVAYRWENKY